MSGFEQEAGERLDTHDSAVLEVDDRLEDDRWLTRFDRQLHGLLRETPPSVPFDERIRRRHRDELEDLAWHVVVGDRQDDGGREQGTGNGARADAVHAALGPTDDDDVGPLRVHPDVRDVVGARDQAKAGVVARRLDVVLAELLVVHGDDDAALAVRAEVRVVGGRTTRYTATSPAPA
jgi:hypothetical protein